MVTLQGGVDTWVQRYEAEKSVQHLAGVRGVINNIIVEAKPVNAGQIQRQIEEALERQAEREARRIGVAVSDGVVTLTGTVRSWGEKNAIDRIAGSTLGVRRVEDRTTVEAYG
ncbi:MAG: BON domain-containing protein [Planctomycetota bacterium]|nr:MAG: BON domain-containing protein [Planctomycetota bacterium]